MAVTYTMQLQSSLLAVGLVLMSCSDQAASDSDGNGGSGGIPSITTQGGNSGSAGAAQGGAPGSSVAGSTGAGGTGIAGAPVTVEPRAEAACRARCKLLNDACPAVSSESVCFGDCVRIASDLHSKGKCEPEFFAVNECFTTKYSKEDITCSDSGPTVNWKKCTAEYYGYQNCVNQ